MLFECIKLTKLPVESSRCFAEKIPTYSGELIAGIFLAFGDPFKCNEEPSRKDIELRALVCLFFGVAIAFVGS